MAKRAMTGTTLQIMLALADGPRHGYGIKLDVEARTDGALSLGSGTLYEAIQRLQQTGWLAEVPPPDATSEGPERRYYTLTSAGRAVLRRELENLDRIVRFAREKDLLAQPRP